MEINILKERRLVEIWLTNTEKDDASVHQRLRPLYQSYQKKKYGVTVYVSGSGDLYQSTRDLLVRNKRCMAGLTV